MISRRGGGARLAVLGRVASQVARTFEDVAAQTVGGGGRLSSIAALGRDKRSLYWLLVILTGAAIVIGHAPSWLALGAGLALALISGVAAPASVKSLTTRSLQLGVIALGAGMNLVAVWQVGSSGALLTMVSLAVAIGVALLLGRWLRVSPNATLLIGVGTAICGGSAIAAVTTVLKPKEHETSVSLAVVFILNAVGLVLFPMLGHALGLTQLEFGRWAALGIHDTSSVVGAGLAYGPEALAIATTTKLARALWIVPLTIAIAVARRGSGEGGGLSKIKWPWFILGFVALAALFTWVPMIAPAAPFVVGVGQRALLLALFLIGLSLSRPAIAKVGARPLVLGVVLWIIVGAVSLRLATLGS